MVTTGLGTEGERPAQTPLVLTESLAQTLSSQLECYITGTSGDIRVTGDIRGDMGD